jgi:hypothetical protein
MSRSYWIAKLVRREWVGVAGTVYPRTERFCEYPGAKLYRGMYRNRRFRGIIKPRFGDDPSKAFRFRSEREARERLSKILGEQLVEKTIEFERVKEEVAS